MTEEEFMKRNDRAPFTFEEILDDAAQVEDTELGKLAKNVKHHISLYEEYLEDIGFENG